MTRLLFKSIRSETIRCRASAAYSKKNSESDQYVCILECKEAATSLLNIFATSNVPITYLSNVSVVGG